ncbi:hypothetical protein BH24CHL6_BH24CHL6_08710 [soil metagenome]
MTPTPADRRLARAWLARRAVAWSRQAKRERLPKLEAALLHAAAEALDAHLAEQRQRVRLP